MSFDKEWGVFCGQKVTSLIEITKTKMVVLAGKKEPEEVTRTFAAGQAWTVNKTPKTLGSNGKYELVSYSSPTTNLMFAETDWEGTLEEVRDRFKPVFKSLDDRDQSN